MANRSAHLFAAALAVSSAAGAFSVARKGGALDRGIERAEDSARALDLKAKEARALVDQTERDRDELDALRTLAELLPQDRGYLRTQAAISEEVQAMRKTLAPRVKNALHIVIDAKANKLFLRKGLKLLWSADCSVGRGGILVDKRTGRKWEFVTPRGEFRVVGKAENPLWRKPDWAYTESNEPIPPPDDPARMVEGELGAYVLNLGDGYLIHGTKNEALLGRPASHGCVRVGAEDLKKLYAEVPIGTRVYIFY